MPTVNPPTPPTPKDRPPADEFELELGDPSGFPSKGEVLMLFRVGDP